MTIKGLSLFENEESDVLKFDLEVSDELKLLRKIAKKFPNEESYPDYHPHITLVYLKPGTGKKYIKNNEIKISKNISTLAFVLSLANGEKIYF